MYVYVPEQMTSDPHLQKHEVELTRREHLLTRDAVGVFLHALLLGEREQLPGHQTQQVELLHV